MNSETAITRAAARSTRGTARGTYVLVQRPNASGCRQTARSWTVTTTGTLRRGGAVVGRAVEHVETLVGSHARQDERVPAELAREHRGAPGAAERERPHAHLGGQPR